METIKDCQNECIRRTERSFVLANAFADLGNEEMETKAFADAEKWLEAANLIHWASMQN